LGKSYEKKSQAQYKEQHYEKEDMEISENLSGQTSVKNLRKVTIMRVQDVQELLQAAFKLRNKAQTKLNNLSSRTHTVFPLLFALEALILQIFTLNVDIFEKSHGQRQVQFHFVDLAGSERTTKNINEEAKFKEEIIIASNLLCLSKVLLDKYNATKMKLICSK